MYVCMYVCVYIYIVYVVHLCPVCIPREEECQSQQMPARMHTRAVRTRTCEMSAARRPRTEGTGNVCTSAGTSAASR